MSKIFGDLTVVVCVAFAAVLAIKGVFGWPLFLVVAFLIKLVIEE